MEHSELFSPSSIHRRIGGCYGSARLEAQVPDEGPKPAADYGTFGHHMASEYLTKGTPTAAWLGKKMFGQVCDQRLIDIVIQYISDIDSLDCKGLIKVESKVSLAWGGYPEMYGTNDLSSDEIFGTLDVLDLKTGSGVEVFPEYNDQLLSYCLMVAGSGIENYERIRLSISQPPFGKMKTWETTPNCVMDWFHSKLEPCIQAILAGDDTLLVSDSNCQWCKAKSICPEYTEHNLAIAQLDFTAVKPSAPIIDDELVNKVYPHISMLKTWIKRLEAHAASMADVGTLQDHKLVAGKNYRSWTDEEEVADELTAMGYDAYDHTLLSPAKAEKLSKEVKKRLQKYVVYTAGKPSIVPVTDKRPALSTLLEEFTDVTK